MSSSTFLAKPNRLSPGAATTSSTANMLSPHPADDFLTFLDPALVVDALASPQGGLRSFLDGASAIDRDFAMRTALASQSIGEWLTELRGWHWPAEGGSHGFETEQRKLFVKVFAPDDDYKESIGCLSAGDITKYEMRIEAIGQDLAKLDLEDIKSHVLLGHILPLSRSPEAPFVSSLVANFNRMDDSSAIIAVIVLQTLPNLARLSRLLDTWSTRLNVLQSINPLLKAISDAEILLQDNWMALSKFPQTITAKITKRKTIKHHFLLSRAAFEARRDALAQTVAEPARILDFMLDSLEGSLDTLPEDWLTRMEEVEKGFGEWIAACERWITETELAEGSRESSQSPSRRRRRAARSGERTRPATDADAGAIEEPAPRRPARFDRLKPGADLADGQPRIDLEDESDWDSSPFQSPNSSVEDLITKKPENYKSRPLYRLDDDFSDPFIRGRRPIRDPLNPMSTLDEVTEDEDEDEDDSADDNYDDTQLTLPPSRNRDRSRDSLKSDASSLVRFDDFDDEDFSEDSASSSRKSRSRGPWNSDDEEHSPGSSPPPESRRRAGSGLLDSPLFEPIPEGDEEEIRFTIPDSFYENDDDSTKSPDADKARSRAHRESVGDIDMRQKISQIIQKISTPNRLRLSTDPPSITLNPPDFKPPQPLLQKKVSREREEKESTPRVSSGMSTRTVTPSFTLSPVRFVRARDRHHHHHSIKVYHLSRNNGETPIKLFVRCVGENGERVMVRVGGGWADLGEYLKEYISHHGRRSSNKEKTNVEVRKLKRHSVGGYSPRESSPPSRPTSGGGAREDKSPMTPLYVRKSRRSVGGGEGSARSLRPKTPGSGGAGAAGQDVSPSETSGRSRSGSHSWVEKESSVLGLAGPSGKKIEMSEEHKAWVESVKDQVRMTNGDMKPQTGRRRRA